MPKAFIVGRHNGQLAALREVFLGTRSVFCVKHLGENIRKVMGTRSPIVGAFGDLIHEKINEEVFLEKLKAESELHVAGTKRRNMLEFLEGNLDHFSPK
jgi:hypothetical protein